MNIDKEIADKVMGWEPHFRNSAHYCDKGDNGVGYKVRGFVNEWHPSRLIGQAFEVVEKMRESGFCFTLCDNDPHEAPGWDAHFFKVFGSKENTFIGTSDTPAIAICLAARKAMED